MYKARKGADGGWRWKMLIDVKMKEGKGGGCEGGRECEGSGILVEAERERKRHDGRRG
jgi:hypothetical protein